MYGRYLVFNCANVLFILWTLVAASSQTSWLFIFSRFLTGCAVASNVLNPAIIGDMLAPEHRGTAMATLMVAPLLGGAIGPAIAGAIAQTIGWRRILWIGAGIAGICELAFLLTLRETYKITILRSRLKKERRASFVSIIDPEKESATTTIWRSIKRPATVFCDSFVLQILSLYGCLVFTFFYIMATTLPSVLESQYGFSPASTGSAFLSFSKLSFLLFATYRLTLNWRRLLRRNRSLQPHPRPHLRQTPHSKQQHRPSRTPYASNNHKRIPTPHIRPPIRLDSSKPLASGTPSLLSRSIRILPPSLHGPSNDLRYRCFRHLLCLGLNGRVSIEMFDEHFSASERCAYH